ncbi:helix-turn-helix domain-containing protein [Spirosoma sp. HMF4905]|uniref:Helix-turn-helix domain-containing protein n=1 Tax=Spirosoma arboris TaxID=2682092 RepID=A0A7K1S629_9BACT|nr:helix-turn-helix transcriptional regulator [Spirosoma arboris]MVM29106.1 helix-turn-helix domain-containing protein [Spirosoma arboris]
MDKVETIEEFYQRKFDGAAFRWMPDTLRQDVGHFNVFRLNSDLESKAKPASSRRRDYYKVNLVIGNCKLHYADKVIEIHKQALVFSHPTIPYKWEQTGAMPSGYFFVFNQEFFHQYGNFNQYSVFQPNGNHVVELSDEQLKRAVGIYERMLEELDSEYIYKYDALRNLVFELLHFSMKMLPSANLDRQAINASRRISTLFSELLERQFPIDDPRQTVQLRSASDFASRLMIHVNHLNRAVKETTQKTSSQLIAERILHEAKILLKHSAWTVSEIAYALGFTEVTYFNSFFKKYTQLSPVKFRNV